MKIEINSNRENNITELFLNLALEIIRQPSDRNATPDDKKIEILLKAAEVYKIISLEEKAKQLLEESFTLAMKIISDANIEKEDYVTYTNNIENLIKLITLYRKFGQSERAELLENKVLHFTSKATSYFIQADGYNYIASYYIEENNNGKAREILDVAFASAKEITDDLEERDFTLINIAENYSKAGAYAEVFECAKFVVDKVRLVFHLYESLVWEYIDTQKYEQLENIIDDAKNIGCKDWILEEAVKSYVEQKDFLRALKALSRLDNKQTKVNCLTIIARQYWEIGNKDRAIENLAQAEEIANTIEDSNSKSWSLQAISKVYSQINNLPKAQEILSDSANNIAKIDKNILELVDKNDVAKVNEAFRYKFTFNSLAFQLASVEKYDEAIKIIESDNLSLPTSQKISLLIQIATKYLQSNNKEQADRTINLAIKAVSEITGQELAIPQEHAQFFAWNDIARYALIHHQYNLALTTVENIGILKFKVSILTDIATTYIKDDKAKQAKLTLDRITAMLTKIKAKEDINYSAIAFSYTQIADYNSAIEVIKLVPSDLSKASILVGIARQYIKSSSSI